MQESVIYQELLEEARQTARQEILEEARQTARQELRLEEARSLVLRQLKRRVGELPDATRSRVEALSVEQLEDLGEALLDFVKLADLDGWLERLP